MAQTAGPELWWVWPGSLQGEGSQAGQLGGTVLLFRFQCSSGGREATSEGGLSLSGTTVPSSARALAAGGKESRAVQMRVGVWVQN